MAEFQEVIQQKKRMCNSIPCCKCDIYRLCGENLSKCPQFIHNNPKKAEEVIMAWAADHPEPVYPSWYRWLIMMGAIGSVEDLFSDLQREIPADIAQKLGVEPKEG